MVDGHSVLAHENKASGVFVGELQSDCFSVFFVQDSRVKHSRTDLRLIVHLDDV